MKKKYFILLLSLFLMSFTVITLFDKPTIYIIGDSTVQNSDGNGRNELWGWGTLLKSYIDTTNINLSNQAKAGTSTRTFISDGRWDKILSTLKQNDFVLIQFGHNDQSEINDSTRARGTLKGTGEEVENIFNLKTKKNEIVHTYGWYMRKFIRETKAKGAIPIVFSLVPREKWKDGKVNREIDYVIWAKKVAEEENAYFVDLNDLIVQKWEAIGADVVRKFFPGDHTHTNIKGALLNVSCVVEGIKAIKQCSLNKYLIK